MEERRPSRMLPYGSFSRSAGPTVGGAGGGAAGGADRLWKVTHTLIAARQMAKRVTFSVRESLGRVLNGWYFVPLFLAMYSRSFKDLVTAADQAFLTNKTATATLTACAGTPSQQGGLKQWGIKYLAYEHELFAKVKIRTRDFPFLSPTR